MRIGALSFMNRIDRNGARASVEQHVVIGNEAVECSGVEKVVVTGIDVIERKRVSQFVQDDQLVFQTR